MPSANNPNGIESFSPRLRGSATLGSRPIIVSTRNGLHHLPPKQMKPRWGKIHWGIITRRRCWRTNTGLNAEIPLGFFRTVVPFVHFAASAAFARLPKPATTGNSKNGTSVRRCRCFLRNLLPPVIENPADFGSGEFYPFSVQPSRYWRLNSALASGLFFTRPAAPS